MSNNFMADNEKDDHTRVQAKLGLDVKDPEFARVFYRAMAYGRQPSPNALLKVMVEDWMLAFESGREIRPFAPPEPPSHRPRTASGEVPSLKKATKATGSR